MTDKELWRKRIAILFNIDQLTGKCDCIRTDEMKQCEVCQQLKIYGDELKKISKELKKRKGVEIQPEIKKSRGEGRVELTVELFKELYDSGLNYKQICDLIGYDESWLYKFRRENGLITDDINRAYVLRNIDKRKLIEYLKLGYTNQMLAAKFETSISSIKKFKQLNQLTGLKDKFLREKRNTK